MKSVNLSPKSLVRRTFFLFFLLMTLLFSPSIFQQTVRAQQSQLSLVDIITALRSKKASLEERNKLLSEGVRQRGITFALNQDLEKELFYAGANDELIEVIRQKSPVVKPPNPKPTPKIEPTPTPTPRPPDFAFYQNRANSNFVLGEYDQAIIDYSKAIELNAKDSTVFFSRGLAFSNKKNFTRAIADYDKVIELDPEESMAYYQRGIAQENAGNLEKAVSDFQKAVELDANNDLAKSSLQKLQASLPKTVPAPDKEVKETVKNNEPAPNAGPPPASITPVTNEPLNVGALKAYAVKLTKPIYPPVERQKSTEGLVTVYLTLDDTGKVVSAKAVNGPIQLRAVSEDAARKSKFNPVLVDNKPVKATGFIVYNFKIS